MEKIYRYRISPLNLLLIGIVALILKIVLDPDPEGWVFLAIPYLIFFGLFVLAIDVVVQFSVTKYFHVLFVELGVLVLFYLFYTACIYLMGPVSS